MFRIFKRIKQDLIDWCIDAREVSIGELHESLYIKTCEIYDGNELKFIEQTYPKDIFVKTPDGYSRIQHTHKSVPYQIYEIKTKSCSIKCADRHILILSDNQEIFACNSKGHWIQTEFGDELVEEVIVHDLYENMYDLELDDEKHVYFTDGILSHNSITSSAYLLWFATFNFNETVLIVSNKNAGAMEMIGRIKTAYLELPMWLKAGITNDGWNKHNIVFDNGSRIISTATSEDSARGLSVSLLFCLGGDTTITLKNKKTNEIINVSMEQAYNLMNIGEQDE